MLVENSPIESINYSLFQLQSQQLVDAEIGNTSTAVESGTEQSETVTFLDNAVGEVVDLPISGNMVARVDNTDDLSLGTFLARPTLVDTTTWTTSDIIGVLKTFQPWYAFLNNAAIKKKIDNFAFLRGNLHIKVVINASPFQYGCVRACYSPLLGFVTNKIRTNLISDLPLLVPYSQQPGFYIYPQANSGGEMTCRFFLHKNWLDITSATEVQNMGTINHVIYKTLAVAVSGGTSSVTLRTYAWMTDVELMGSTSKLALQGKDEYGTGPVSQPASAVASVASMLTKIPVIGRFARATELGAGAVSQIAQLFGYTNVPVIDDIHAFRPMNAPMLASAHIGTPVQKLTLDPKQELSIDPSPHGIGSMDELALSYLRDKESYFGGTSWSTTDLAGTQIFNMRVSPSLWSQTNINNAGAVKVGTRVYHVPLSYVGAMFKHWRGDLKVRIKVVCTKFHKGRLKISYDPRNDISTTDPGENVVYTEILDIGEHDDVEFTIPYHQDLGWLQYDQTLTENWTPGNPLAPRLGVDNGVLTVRVLNTLTAPAAGTVNLLFFVRGGDNFEFANPAGHIGPDGTNVVPSFFALQGEDKTNIVSDKIIIGKPSITIPERYGLNFGEAVGSLRNILHRSQVFETTPLSSATGGLFNIVRKAYKRMPYTPGYDPSWTATSASNVVAASGSNPFIFNTMSHIPYISGMFLGYRGSVNYTITPSTELYGFMDEVRVVRATDTGATTAAQRFVSTLGHSGYTPTMSNKANILNRGYYSRDGLAGMAITTTRTNGSVVFNFPDYNNFNFSLVDPTIYVAGSSVDGTDSQAVVLQLLLKRVASGDPNTSQCCALQSEVSAGPDFTCLHFLCCPTVDYQLADPTPA